MEGSGCNVNVASPILFLMQPHDIYAVALFNVLELTPLWPSTWHIGINRYKQQMLWAKTHHCTIVIC
jgi:hypothetical protein